MASTHTKNPRRRSQSVSNIPPITRYSPKREHPTCLGTIQGQEQAQNTSVSKRLPSSSADFNLFPKSRRLRDCSLPRPNNSELNNLRSKAFWELRQSVAENGEGFVRRMRDYERMRSRQTVDPCRRTRKRAYHPRTARNSPYLPDSDVSDDDDSEVQIFAGESLSDISQSHHTGKWASSSSVSNPSSWPPEGDYSNRPGYVLPVLSPHPPFTHHWGSKGCPEPAGFPETLPLMPSTISSTLPHTPSQNLDSSNFSAHNGSTLPLPSPFLSSPSIEQTIFVSPDKIVSDLGLALANGAGSINDYSYAENLPTIQQMDGGEMGELWH